MPQLLKIWLKIVPNYAVSFCRLQLIYSLVLSMISYIPMMVCAKGNIKWMSIMKSFFAIFPFIFTILSFHFKGAPFWLYMANNI